MDAPLSVGWGSSTRQLHRAPAPRHAGPTLAHDEQRGNQVNRTMTLVALAVMLAGCATTATYTNPAKGNDPQAMQSALSKCEKAAQVACQTAGDGARVCTERNVKLCMESEGWTEK